MKADAISLPGRAAKYTLLDTGALLFVYLTPAISHLLNFPLYLLEPMRIMLILALAHTSRRNAYLIALSLPFFSFIISAHPSLIKSLLITGELLLNVFLFAVLTEKIKNIFSAALLSILLSKLIYYAAKYFCISYGLLEQELFSTPLLLQFILAFIFSGYLLLTAGRDPH